MSHNPRKIWRIAPGASMRLAEIDPGDTAGLPDKDEAKERLAEDSERIDELQDILFAERERSLLIVLQGMDTSGKDGTVKAVFRATGPLGVAVTAFAKPSEEELAHDFLWRVHKVVPRFGSIGVFNRSHYEEVLVTKLHPQVLEAQKLPPSLDPSSDADRFWKHRYKDIRNFERYIGRQGTVPLKFFLHISREEQRKRLLSRLEDTAKFWKFSKK